MIGLTNNQSKVISLEIKELKIHIFFNCSLMGYRGSKSIILFFVDFYYKKNKKYYCKRATSRRFLSIYNTLRCILVAGKPVFSLNYLYTEQ